MRDSKPGAERRAARDADGARSSARTSIRALCIGCGACEKVCPVQDKPAVYVTSVGETPHQDERDPAREHELQPEDLRAAARRALVRCSSAATFRASKVSAKSERPLPPRVPPRAHRRARPSGSCARPGATCPSTASSARSTRSSRSVKTPELAVEVTLQPLQLGVDAAILFADILLPLEPMGASFEFAKGEGPVIHEPIAIARADRPLRVIDPEDGLGYVLEAIRSLKQRAARCRSSASPARRSRSRATSSRAARARTSRRRRSSCTASPTRGTRSWRSSREVVRRYLRAQIDAGADAVQLFDSWVGRLSRRRLPRVRAAARAPHPRRTSRRAGVPVIHFGDRHGHAARGAARRGRDGDRRRLAHAARRRPGSASATTARSRATSIPCALLAPREVAVQARAARARRGRRAAGAHLQPRPRHPAGDAGRQRRSAVVDYVHEASAR